MQDHLGRPMVAVTGIGAVTPLGFGVAESWSALLAGRSGLRRITRFPTEHLRTSIAGTVDLPEEAGHEPYSTPVRVERIAAIAVQEALEMAALGQPGSFPGPLFLGMPPVKWNGRNASPSPARQAPAMPR